MEVASHEHEEPSEHADQADAHEPALTGGERDNQYPGVVGACPGAKIQARLVAEPGFQRHQVICVLCCILSEVAFAPSSAYTRCCTSVRST